MKINIPLVMCGAMLLINGIAFLVAFKVISTDTETPINTKILEGHTRKVDILEKGLALQKASLNACKATLDFNKKAHEKYVAQNASFNTRANNTIARLERQIEIQNNTVENYEKRIKRLKEQIQRYETTRAIQAEIEKNQENNSF